MDKNFSIKLISLATKPEVARIYGNHFTPWRQSYHTDYSPRQGYLLF